MVRAGGIIVEAHDTSGQSIVKGGRRKRSSKAIVTRDMKRPAAQTGRRNHSDAITPTQSHRLNQAGCGNVDHLR